MFDTRPLRTIYFAWMEGCDACASAWPEWQRFLEGNPAVAAMAFDANGSHPLAARVKSTPTYILLEGNAVVQAHVGKMTAVQIERFYNGN